MRVTAWIAASGLIALSIGYALVQDPEVPIVGGPCEGCEAVFQGMPEEIGTRGRIAPASEPGEPLRITGTVYAPDGSPAAGIIVYAYHTDAHGIYPRVDSMRAMGTAAWRHGRLRAWVRTDPEGRYRFDTIRPASYPDTREPQHVHMHIIEPGRCTYWIDSIHFTDDRFLTRVMRRQVDDGRGGSGIVTPRRDADGMWLVERDIRLGQGVTGYPPWR